MADRHPALGSDQFMRAVADRAHVAGRIQLELDPTDVEVLSYALRETMLLANADDVVPAWVPPQAGDLLSRFAFAAGVAHRLPEEAPPYS